MQYARVVPQRWRVSVSEEIFLTKKNTSNSKNDHLSTNFCFEFSTQNFKVASQFFSQMGKGTNFFSEIA